ncbi:bifunctional phosphopantothenoylcysteine decarboxylase/phosphopantothenate--cysteine ligase CoaBC [Synechococcus sp. UW140]|uniref:bifunctional phosphopantothenoylcysteine decarboxylase/phosphopantothenate--cysteine ligase CoaBC n=1 Tax=Synechococcus sp. UW140 TaxID=368503 RepID=UPI0025D865F3|nr:bifunctional phosphopantothenoylcysteine decarboxylase/phosphopantothenate--cysteine ligase CoaBC [Synechococcus sp. UW140]
MLAAAADPLANKRILLAVSGSIAAVKVPQLVSALVQRGALVRCVLTPSAAQLVSPAALASLSRHHCHLEADQWLASQPRPLHIELAEWAELLLLVPLSASSMARLAHGLADNLVASIFLAAEAPRLLAAAMNTSMWQAAAVQRNWQVLRDEPQTLALPPAGDGLLACDRRGAGRMREPAQLLLAAESLAIRGATQDLKGLRLLITAGPSREELDPARYLSNPSTGRMGVMLALAAQWRGAEVKLLHGPLELEPALLEGLQCFPFINAAQLQLSLSQHQSWADGVVMAAAVADQRLRKTNGEKLSKAELQHQLLQPDTWELVPDLLQELVANRPRGQVLMGFCAHSGNGLTIAKQKLQKKGCDLLFANPIDLDGAGFGAINNQGWLLQQGGEPQQLGPCSKLALAHQLLDNWHKCWQ